MKVGKLDSLSAYKSIQQKRLNYCASAPLREKMHAKAQRRSFNFVEF